MKNIFLVKLLVALIFSFNTLSAASFPGDWKNEKEVIVDPFNASSRPAVGLPALSEVVINVNWPEWSEENKIEVYDPSNNLIETICVPGHCYVNEGSNYPYSESINLGCLPNGSGYKVILFDRSDDGWDGGGFMEVFSGGTSVLTNDGVDENELGITLEFTVDGGGACLPVASVFAVQPSCSDGIALSDGYLQISSYSYADRYNFSEGSTYTGDTDYNNAIAIGALPFKFNMGLANPVGSKDYTVRVFNDCGGFTDYTVTMNEQDCAVGCNCSDYIYLNDIQNNVIHKFQVDSSNGGLTEIGGPWNNSGLLLPHGVAIDNNGFLYIAEIDSDYTQSTIHKLTCDGEIVDRDWLVLDYAVYNLVGTGDALYINGDAYNGENKIEAYDLCTATLIGCQYQNSGWGFSSSFDGQRYLNTEGWDGPDVSKVWSGPLDRNYFSATDCPSPAGRGPSIEVISSVGDTSNDAKPMGVTEDDEGNIYVVVTEGNGGDSTTYIRKFNSSGSVLATSASDSDLSDNVGWSGGRGIVYSASSGYLYVASRDDCISVFDKDLNYISNLSVPYEVGAEPKALGILTECCPTNNNISIDTTLCAASVNDQISLQSLVNCTGTICEGLWTEGASNTGLNYNSCDNSVTIAELGACGTFTLESKGTGNNPQCGAFTITVNIVVNSLELSVTETACEESAPGIFTTTYNAEVNWSSEPCSAGELINVTHNNTLIGTIDPSTDNSPSNFPFTVAATGNGSHTVEAAFTTSTCSDQTFFETPVPCKENIPTCNVGGAGCVGGKVFEDLNFNGNDEHDNSGIQGVQVQIYDADQNLVGIGYSDAEGDWQVCGLEDGEEYRIEHLLPETIAAWAQPTPVINGESGTGGAAGGGRGIAGAGGTGNISNGNQSDIQFMTAPACTKFSIGSPDSYCQENPTVVTSCFVSGVYDGGNSSEYTLVSFPYSESGSTYEGTRTVDPTTVASMSEIGNVYGLAYKTENKTLYMAAFHKLYAGYGPHGTGAIYQSVNNGTPSLFVDLNSVFGANTTGANSHAAITDPFTGAGNDPYSGDNSIADPGKVAFGDMDISSDGAYLYVVSLANKKLYKIPTTGALNSSTIVGYDIPTNCPGATVPCANSNDLRPFGLKMFKGKLYIGMVYTAERSQNRAELNAFVYTFDPLASQFSNAPVLEFPLDFERGFAVLNEITANWQAWSDSPDYTASQFSSIKNFGYPQPILSDIEFDNENMIIGMRDRFGDQFAPDFNYAGGAASAGDIHRACGSVSSGWVFEANGTCGGVTTYGAGNNKGPNGGEFYYQDKFDLRSGTSDYYHQQTSIGGLLKVPFKNEVAVAVYNPNIGNANDFNAAGIAYYRNRAGLEGIQTRHYEVYDQSTGGYPNSNTGDPITFDKANGLGDLEAFCDPAPIEIGNRIWVDADKDGIQDASEMGLDGVKVQLFDRNCVQVAETTTANGGCYFFNGTNVDTADYTMSPTVGFTGLSFNTNYYIVVGDGAFAANELTVSGTAYKLSIPDAGTSDNIDSDGSVGLACGALGSLPYKAIDTGAPGLSNHSYDFGFCEPRFSLGNRVFADINDDGDQDSGEDGIDGVTLQLLRGDGTNYPIDINTGGNQPRTVITANGGYYRFDDLPAGSYMVEVLATNLATSAVLDGYVSSSGANQEASPDNDVDQNDNGLDVLVSGAIRSGIVTLGSPEVINESDEPTTYGAGSIAPSNGLTPTDSYNNLTVDFGFYTCVNPSAITFSQVAPTCNGITAENNGTISITGLTNGTHYGVSTLGATTYDGPTSITGGTAATAIVGTPVIHSTVPNTGGSYIVRIFNGTDSCYSDETVTVAEVICYPCEFTDSGLTTPVCDNGGTGTDPTDDRVTFDLNPTGISLGSNYTLTVSGGATITPSTGTYGSATSFQLQAGSAGAGNVTVTITDDTDATCTLEVLIPDPGSCSNDRIDLELTKVADKSVAKIGDDILFTLELKNEGNITANNIIVNDDLPSSVTFKSANSSTGSYDEISGEWSIDSLEASHSLQLFIVARLIQDTIVCNIAQVTAADEPDSDSTPNNDNGDQSEDDEYKALVFVQPEIDLSITKAVSQKLVDAGDEITYTITVQNDGPSIAHDVIVKDLLPAGIVFDTFMSSSDQTANRGTYSAANGNWTIDSISVGETLTLALDVTVTSINNMITNCAEVISAAEPDVDSSVGNGNVVGEDDSACADINKVEYDIVLLKDIFKGSYVLGNRKVKLGEEITYVLRVTNPSSGGLTGVAVTDQLPIGVEYVSQNGDGNYDVTTGLWTPGYVSPKSQLRMDIVVKVIAAGMISNTAEVSSMDQTDIDSIPGNGVESEDDQQTVTMEVLKPKKKFEIKVGGS